MYSQNDKISFSKKENKLKFVWGEKDFLAQYSEGYKSVPTSFNVSNAYPNPFNPVVNINYELPQESNVTAVIYNVLGQQVKTIHLNELKETGYHKLQWHGLNNLNQQVSTGIYFLKMFTGTKQITQKLVLIK